MFSVFLPISLLVLAGFTLGLLVGWLTWVYSKASTNQERAEQEIPNDAPERAPDPPSDWAAGRDPVADWSTSNLPVWRMREVSKPGYSDAPVPPNPDPSGSRRNLQLADVRSGRLNVERDRVGRRL